MGQIDGTVEAAYHRRRLIDGYQPVRLSAGVFLPRDQAAKL
jgi:hypothetical protein